MTKRTQGSRARPTSSRRSGGPFDQTFELTCPLGQPFQHFGAAVDVEGDRILIGGPQTDLRQSDDAGAAWLYEWNEQLPGWHDTPLPWLNTAADAWFGWAATISGQECLVGAVKDSGSQPKTGAAYSLR